MWNKLNIKAISLNEAYRGKRFSTKKLKKFKIDIFKLLKPMKITKGKKLSVTYKFGVSSKSSDGDNLIKVTQDCLAEAYDFNDKIIYQWFVEKHDVAKGKEYIEFLIVEL